MHSFCGGHARDHQQILTEQMDRTKLDYDRLHQKSIEQLTEFDQDQHSLLNKQIEQWETQSICYDTSRRVADETRQEILNIVSEHLINVIDKLKEITQRLNQVLEKNQIFLKLK